MIKDHTFGYSESEELTDRMHSDRHTSYRQKYYIMYRDCSISLKDSEKLAHYTDLICDNG